MGEKIRRKKKEKRIYPSLTNKCNKCDYNASSKSILKRHVTSTHKKNMSTLKTDRSKEHDTFLQLLVNLEERAEALFCRPQPVDKDLNQTSSNLQFNCELCKHEIESETALHGHKYLTNEKYIYRGALGQRTARLCVH